ncbi:hypothetical protein [Streptomyces sp. R41]|uniref:Uncharacterized protein n=1 Tax=Streptomyces sp. R41 TaxID=3238632 RepID=A0AB39RPL4_9ACTN
MGSPATRTKVLRYAAVLVGAVAVCVFLLRPGAWLLAGDSVRGLPADKRARELDETRRTLVAAVVAGSTLTGLGYTVRHYLLARRGQVTDRYGKAVAQLASAQLVEVLGGVYALEHVMRESEDDHETVVEVLAAFVRTKSPVRPGATGSWSVGEDVAAMKVLARRPSRPERNRIDLRRTDLTGLALATGADRRAPVLARADLCEARLVGVRMPVATPVHRCR